TKWRSGRTSSAPSRASTAGGRHSAEPQLQPRLPATPPAAPTAASPGSLSLPPAPTASKTRVSHRDARRRDAPPARPTRTQQQQLLLQQPQQQQQPPQPPQQQQQRRLRLARSLRWARRADGSLLRRARATLRVWSTLRRPGGSATRRSRGRLPSGACLPSQTRPCLLAAAAGATRRSVGRARRVAVRRFRPKVKARPGGRAERRRRVRLVWGWCPRHNHGGARLRARCRRRRARLRRGGCLRRCGRSPPTLRRCGRRFARWRRRSQAGWRRATGAGEGKRRTRRGTTRRQRQ
ncbi:hypothetical protein EMIHUDRAFT_451032, partial [Emiliania huxleyi CCMP1516]|uniref:Uncharacterized protein n=2 Tax=Emiliania huxleyi TaxID=2903 RepID=A0A0D3J8Y9_EMIH1